MDRHSLLEKIRSEKGEIELQQIYTLYKPEFVRWARKEYGIQTDAGGEVFQQVMIIFYENVINRQLTVLDSELRTYLYAIGKNKIREFIREETKLTDADAYEYSVESTAFSEENANEHKLKVTKVRKSLDLLGDPCKSMLVDFYYRKRSIKDIMVDYRYKNDATARRQKYRCLQRLKKVYFSTRQSFIV